MPWSEVGRYVEGLGREVVPIQGGGFCFIDSVVCCLQRDYGVDCTRKSVIKQVLSHITDNLKYYTEFHQGTSYEFLEQCKKFFKKGKYLLDAVDVCILATTNALALDLNIIEKYANNVHTITNRCDMFPAEKEIFLKYSYHPNPKFAAGNHYDAVVLSRKNSERDDDDEPEAFLASTPNVQHNDTYNEESPIIWSASSDEEGLNGGARSCAVDAENIINTAKKATAYRSKNQKNVKTKIDVYKFENIAPEKVEKVPHDIDGDVRYVIEDVCGHDWHELQVDGRYFKMNSGKKKGTQVVRKIGSCQGSYICQNATCPKLTTEGVLNRKEFKADPNGTGVAVCAVCDFYGHRVHCGCIKVTEYDPVRRTLSVFHEGKHNCLVKTDIKGKSKILEKELIDGNIQGKPKQLRNKLIGRYLLSEDPTKALEMAALTDDRSILDRMRYVTENKSAPERTEVESFANIANLKLSTDTIDPNLIAFTRCRALTSKPTYVFKTSTDMARLALKMDNNLNPPLVGMANEDVYLDAMHSRCLHYKTLTLWTYHKGMRRVLCMATMEAERENTESLTLFLRLFNRVVAAEADDPNFVWRVKRFMCDEHGGNQNAILKVFGREMMAKTVTCQWHFRKCAREEERKINPDERHTFNKCVQTLMYAPTEHAFKKASRNLIRICERNGCLDWYKWWEERRYHIVLAYRGFHVSGLNLAEVGHSTMDKKLSLAMATLDDVTTMIAQVSDYRGHIANTSKSSGKGPTQMEVERRQERHERDLIQAYCDIIEEGGDLEAEQNIQQGDPRAQEPARSAKHKAPKVYRRKNPTQMGRSPGRSPLRAKRSKRTTPKRKRRRLNEDSELDESGSDAPDLELDRVPHAVEQNHLQQNPPTVCFLNVTIKKCYGCDTKFKDQEREEPMDLVLKYKTKRRRPKDPRNPGGEWIKSHEATNTYYHCYDLGCLLNEAPDVRRDRLFMVNETFFALTNGHREVLKRRGFWDHIVRNRLALRSGEPL